MTTLTNSKGVPLVTYDERSKTWILENDLEVTSRGFTIQIPAGFKTDLASIPRFLWNLEAPYELSLAAPIVHDWGYRHGGHTPVISPVTKQLTAITFTRKDIDDFFNDLMEQAGVSKFRRVTAYYGVRLFGGKAWTDTQSTSINP